MNKLKQNWYLILIALATVALGIIAVVTAIKLYQIGKAPVAPTVPKPAPAREPVSACKLTFNIGGVTPTPTGTITPTPTETLTPTPTTPTGTITPTPTTPTGTITPTPTSSVTLTPTPTSPPGATPTPTPTQVELPKAGVAFPTLGAILGGLLLIGMAIILAF